MAQPVLITERIISGKGVLKIPQENLKDRFWTIFIDVIRNPINEYKSFDWNPTKSVYARMVFRRRGYVIDYRLIEFEQEVLDYILDVSGQTLIATKCAYEGVLQSFANLGNALLLPTISVSNLTTEMASLQLGFDEVLFNCYSSTGLQIRLFSTRYETCGEDNPPTQNPPPPPPPRNKIPPNTPIADISAPYDPDTNDDGNTKPYTIDELPPVVLNVTYNIGANGNLAGSPPVSLQFAVPNNTFIAEMRNGTSPAVCAATPGLANPAPQPQETWAVGGDGTEILLFQHNTCNLISILSQNFV